MINSGAELEMSMLRMFLIVIEQRSFSRAAAKVHRTQPAVSQAVRRLELQLGEQLFDRKSKAPVLTEAGEIVRTYAERILALSVETHSAVRELRDLRRGRVLIGTNEAGVHAILPILERFRRQHPDIEIDVRRVHARQVATEVQQGSLDVGVMTFQPPNSGLRVVSIGTDEVVLLVPPSHPFARLARVEMSDIVGETVIAHNDPSPLRDRVLRLFERKNLALRMMMSLPSLDAIKRAVEMNLGIALLPRRCALTELVRKQLVAIQVVGLSRKRRMLLVWRNSTPSHAARVFVSMAQTSAGSGAPAADRVDGGAPPTPVDPA
jgi:DNA-binding transcriptional LysR family regulator